MTSAERAREQARTLEEWGHARSWAGPDPYEGLNATRLVTPLRRSALGSRVVMQLVKRSPVDLRGLLGIEQDVNATTLAWVASAYALGGFLDEELTEARLRETVGRLLAMRCAGYDEHCWGYHFNYHSRVVDFRRGEPNTIATSYVGQALLDAHERTRDDEALEAARGAGRFFLRHVPRSATERGACFGYAVGNRALVHNANMHVAALLARLASFGGPDEEELRAAAAEALEFTVSRQRADGSWPYGETANTAWVDSFHTGYVLDALRTCVDCDLDRGAHDAWHRGLRYYRDVLFAPDGTARYSASSTYPVDVQCVAQGIQTFAIASRHEPGWLDDARRVFDFGMRRMRRGDGLFVFQRHRLWVNRAVYPRWVVAPTLLALAHLIAAETAAIRSASALPA